MILLHYAAVSGEIPSGLINKLGILIDNRQYIFYRSKFKDFFINLQAITDKIKLSSDLYEIVEWTAVVHKNPKERQTWAINMIRPMPNKNLTLCPVFAEKKAKKTGFNL